MRQRLVWGAVTGLLAACVGLCAVAPASACAQTPDLPIPTLGPLDPTCADVPDTDRDSVLDYEDNCHRLSNRSQTDTDQDSGAPPYEAVPVTFRDPVTGGDACDVDDDADAIEDIKDTCPKVADPDQRDSDSDGAGDACDTSPTVPSATPAAQGPEVAILRLARSYRSAELRAGLAVPVRCSAACILSGRLRAGRKTLGKGAGGLEGAGSTFVFVRFSKAGRSRLARARWLRATVTVTGADDIGHSAKRSRRVTLKR